MKTLYIKTDLRGMPYDGRGNIFHTFDISLLEPKDKLALVKSYLYEVKGVFIR